MMLYKVPPEPSARRVYVWRKLKRLGAILVHDAAWVLPDSARNREQFQWLAAEILEMGGDAAVWETRLLLAGQDETLTQQFLQQAAVPYREILAELAGAEPDLAALSRRFQQAQAQDYFGSPLGRQVREALLSARGGSEA
ncbi:MAG TPA: Chromate resistance protein ChrB [Symbiobacteriaceae bacterium]|jgi:hypothetical protein